ncbi:MAG TPA: Stp1/IreP family PP2C-type Ser/Thr phosphatase [Terriglobales bacterium]|nr:Stp1/IreP family PP2C-type Ser/Thr phosphatase [Terriglobales bacterium]
MEYRGVTHIGLVRSQNQDCYECFRLPGGAVFAVVCDGMGGPLGGEVASALSRDIIRDVIDGGYTEGLDGEAVMQLLRVALEAANAAVFERGASENEHAGMGTTVVAALIRKGEAFVANVGDSRAYLFTEQGLEKITHDHSVVQEMLDGGTITENEARSHPQKNIITRALGTQESVNIDIFRVDVAPGNRILLCSDGLTNMVEDADISWELARPGALDQVLSALLHRTLEAGATDNITAVAVEL